MGGSGSKQSSAEEEVGKLGMLAKTQLECKMVFELLDTNKNGVIDPNEIAKAMEDAGFENVSTVEVQEMMREVDTNQSGTLDYPEFARFWVSKMSSRESAVEMLKVIHSC
eukprot:SAG22_NODE_6457_length_851_cov_1.698138_1_plen_110_part_00